MNIDELKKEWKKEWDEAANTENKLHKGIMSDLEIVIKSFMYILRGVIKFCWLLSVVLFYHFFGFESAVIYALMMIMVNTFKI